MMVLFQVLVVGYLASIGKPVKLIYMQNLSEAQLRELARKRVEFRRHLVVFCVINATLWLLWWMTGQGYPWPIWPLAGWGIGLVFHYIFDFSSPKLFSEEEEYDRLRHLKDNEHVAQ